jgi:uncharacterized linocin/CFP29 family protein
MAATPNQGGLWTPAVWQAINSAVQTTFASIAVARKVFPAVELPGVMAVPVDTLTPGTPTTGPLSIPEGQTEPYFEVEVRFSLTYGQVNSDAAGQTALTLAPLAAKSLAMAEDGLLFQGAASAGATIMPAPAPAAALLGLRTLSPVPVTAPATGAHILAAISGGVGQLIAASQAPAFALVLGTTAYAATYGSLIGAAPTSNLLASILTGGIFVSATLPPDRGLLIALGGNPTTIFFSDPPAVEFLYRDTTGSYVFRVFERVLLMARDTTAFVTLHF